MLPIEKFISELKENAISSNGERIGWSCTFMPVEIIDAGGFIPMRILPPNTSVDASSYLDPNFCPYIKTILSRAIEGYYSELKGVILVNTCDGMRRLYDAWSYYLPEDPLFLLDVPKLSNEQAIRLFESELGSLISSIETHFDIKIKDEYLFQSICLRNRISDKMERLILLQHTQNKIPHSALIELMGLGFQIPPMNFLDELERLEKEIKSINSNEGGRGIKILVSGSIQCGSGIIRLIEEMGGEVVQTDFCTGVRYQKKIREDIPPLRALAEGYLLQTPCPRMYESHQRLSIIKEAIERKDVKGVIHVSMKFCDTYLYEADKIKSILEGLNVPSLFIETEYKSHFGGNIRTRVQAFMELLESHDGRF